MPTRAFAAVDWCVGRTLGAVGCGWRDDAELSPRDASAALAEALQASVALEALAVAGMGVWDWDVVTGVFTWDDQIARLHGIGPNDFDGTLASFLSRVRPEDEPAVSAAFEEALHRGGEFRTEFRVVRPDGTTAWIQH